MRIAQIAPLFESVPPKLYGGTERVVSYLTDALIKLGHEVTLFASGDSVSHARLIACSPQSLRLNGCRDPLAYHVLEFEQVYKRAEEFDIIHNHNDYLAYSLARRCPTPTVTTLHGSLDIPELVPLYKEFMEIPLVSISLAQRTPLAFANWVGNVYHGIPADLYTFNGQPQDYLAFVGRLSPEKRIDSCIDIANRSNKHLKIAAKLDDRDKEHYEKVLKEKLDHPQVDYIGEIKDKEKDAFIGNAQGFIFPIDWAEPFGLVMIEALACGTPVIARKRGSIPEVVENGVTGFTFETDDEGVEAVNKLTTINREQCRKVFEDKFTDIKMALEYIKIYQKLISQRKEGRV